MIRKAKTGEVWKENGSERPVNLEKGFPVGGGRGCITHKSLDVLQRDAWTGTGGVLKPRHGEKGEVPRTEIFRKLLGIKGGGRREPKKN